MLYLGSRARAQGKLPSRSNQHTVHSFFRTQLARVAQLCWSSYAQLESTDEESSLKKVKLTAYLIAKLLSTM